MCLHSGGNRVGEFPVLFNVSYVGLLVVGQVCTLRLDFCFSFFSFWYFLCDFSVHLRYIFDFKDL